MALLWCLVPLTTAFGAAVPTDDLREVTSVIDIDAPPEVVWDHIVVWNPIPRGELPWYFKTGIAYPTHARIEGTGVGAVRYCEFSTGAFVEPITVWEPGRRLAFDVMAQPAAMQETSFWAKVHAPHLETGFRSHRGEFRLTPLPGGGTRVAGTTWYTLGLAPEAYWGLWADAILHRIHARVFAQIRSEAEAQPREALRNAPMPTLGTRHSRGSRRSR